MRPRRALALVAALSAVVACEAIGGIQRFERSDATDGGVKPCDQSHLPDDAANCGRCGHDCRGGTCKEGHCQPVLLAGDEQTPNAIAVSGDWVYYTVSSPPQIKRVPKRGGGPAQVIATQIADTNALAVDPSGVYGFIVVTSGDCGDPPTNGASDLTRFAPDGTNADGGAFVVATLDWGSCSSFGTGAIAVDPSGIYTHGGRFAADGGALAIGNYPTTAYLVLDDRNLYWNTGVGVATLPKANLPDGGIVSATTLASGQTSTRGLAVDAKRVYWGSPQSGAVRAVPKSSQGDAGPTAIAVGLAQIADVAVDVSNVYWGAAGSAVGGTIGYCAVDGCAGQEQQNILAEQPGTPVRITVDAEAIYWTTTVGTVLKVVKP